MLPQAPRRKQDNSTRVNLLISLFFHVTIVALLVFFAARQGFLGEQMRKITVQIVREKPPEKPKAVEKPKEEPLKAEPPKTVETAKVEAAKAEPPMMVAPAPPPSAVVAPSAVAPAAVVRSRSTLQRLARKCHSLQLAAPGRNRRRRLRRRGGSGRGSAGEDQRSRLEEKLR